MYKIIESSFYIQLLHASTLKIIIRNRNNDLQIPLCLSLQNSVNYPLPNWTRRIWNLKFLFGNSPKLSSPSWRCATSSSMRKSWRTPSFPFCSLFRTSDGSTTLRRRNGRRRDHPTWAVARSQRWEITNSSIENNFLVSLQKTHVRYSQLKQQDPFAKREYIT